jgi:hypothetical protein
MTGVFVIPIKALDIRQTCQGRYNTEDIGPEAFDAEEVFHRRRRPEPIESSVSSEAGQELAQRNSGREDVATA